MEIGPVFSNGVQSAHAFEMQSRHVGDRFRIDVGWPFRSNPEKGPELPVLYVLDGNMWFSLVHYYCMLQSGDLIRPGFETPLVVAIGYPDAAEMAVKRTRDLTPEGANPEEIAALTRDAARALNLSKPEGGADAFLRFIVDELTPAIRSRYAVKADEFGIVGDSYGGLFTFHCVTQRAPLFNRFWLGSPGIFDNFTHSLDAFEQAVAAPHRPLKLHVSWGELEEEGSVEMYRQLGRNTRRLTEILARSAHPNVAWRHMRHPDATHTTVAFPALFPALDFLYGPA